MTAKNFSGAEAMATNWGLAGVREIYQNRDRRARELRGQGKKVIGYFCAYPPVEIITAADLVPYRIMGNVKEPITKADAYLETVTCPYIRNCFDAAIKGGYDFLDGIVVPHSCDPVERMSFIWPYYLKPAYSHCINVPHVVRPAAYEFFRAEVGYFKETLEEFVGSKISDQHLREAIDLHNENRSLVRELYELRKQDPPLLSGAETTQILVAAMSIPVEECNELLRSVISEVEDRRDGPKKKRARVLIHGCEIDDVAFMQLVEDCGANVVIDDLCIGTRFYWHDVERTEDPLDGLTTRYLDKVMCPRTYRGGEPKERFGHILDYARGFNANSVILYIIRFCDTHAYDVPDLRDYLREAALPVLHLEDDYSLTTIGQLRTRVQAFLEIVG